MTSGEGLAPDQRASQYLVEAARDYERVRALGEPDRIQGLRLTLGVLAYAEVTDPMNYHSNAELTSIASAALSLARSGINDSPIEYHRVYVNWRQQINLAFSKLERTDGGKEMPKSSLEIMDLLKAGKLRITD